MIKIKDAFYKMKLNELNMIVNMFELRLRERKKEYIVDTLSEYMKSNIHEILQEVITYDELKVLKKVCHNNYEIVYKESDFNYKDVKSLCTIGILCICKEEKCKICIPLEIREQIKLCLDDKHIIEFSKNRSDLIKMVSNLLEVYGAFTLEVLENYIIKTIGRGYRIHRAIESIRKYNQRNNFYNEDENYLYYNIKISDIESVKKKIYELDFTYRYYDESQINDILNKKSVHEEGVYRILNRVYKNPKVAEVLMEDIRFMVREGKTNKEIECFVKQKAKKISDFGLKSICKSIDKIRNDYIIWGFKGNPLGELQIFKEEHNFYNALL